MNRTIFGARGRFLGFCLLAMVSIFIEPGAVAQTGRDGAAPTQPKAPASGPGAVLDNSGIIPFDQAFFAFEVESALESLKNTPIWDELEQLLDNPYMMVLAPDIPPNAQGFASYRSTIQRRRSFLPPGCTYQSPVPAGLVACIDSLLPAHTVHPLNYNHMTGEELRLLNPGFEAALWQVPDDLIDTGEVNAAGLPIAQWTYEELLVSEGLERVEEGETGIDFNSPIMPDEERCIISTELVSIDGGPPIEGVTVCGADPGEPGYAGFGVLRGSARRPEQYSVPAVPNSTMATTIGLRLYDPERGFINPRDPVTGAGGLRKPSLRVPPFGTPANPGFTVNSVANLAADPTALSPSNENDYYRGTSRAQKQTARRAAEALGKALFWDMQVGSDSVQACGTCHFHAGADNRTKNQLNPNHVGGDLDLELFSNRATPPANPQDNNQDVVASDFPLHKLHNRDIPGERAADGAGIVDFNPENVASHTNDVMSSMGVRFRLFADIRTPGAGAFGPDGGFGIRTLLPDLGNDPVGGQALDPIPVFQGLRRVEPRNTPTLFGTAMNFDNFWDGRARHDFNGGSVFGPSDPQSHVWVNSDGTLVPTRQIIRFASIASLATGPALSEFEMSFQGRNWAKHGKRLLQGVPLGNGTTRAGDVLRGRVTPLANQLVSTTDSVLGIYSNQGGSACAGLPTVDRVADVPTATATGKPGLCISYPGLIRRAFYPALWINGASRLNGCYTDGNVALHPNQCPTGAVSIPVLQDGEVIDASTDPFDNYVLRPASGAAAAANTNQFSQMEANMPLFFGLAVHAWVTMLLPDNTPFDQFMDDNPESYLSFGESNEPGIGLDLLPCSATVPQPCFTEIGNFKRDPDVMAWINVTSAEGVSGMLVRAGGTRQPGDPDPLLGLDMFLGSNLSLKNPNFRSFRCGECHAAGTLTDHTNDVSHQTSFGDFVQEFLTGQPGIEAFPEPIGRSRVITGFALEGELQENAQDGIERNIANFALDGLGTPQAQALFDNGVYNIGVTPISNDIGRGANDAFGWPMSLSILALKNLGGTDYSPGGDDPLDGFADPAAPGIPLATFDPTADPECVDHADDPDYLASHVACNTGGLFEESAQDQEINPGFGEEPANPLLPPHLAPWASNIPVGDEANQDELFFGLNTLMEEPMLEGFSDVFGPFNPAAVVGEMFNNSNPRQMASWPVVNKVNRMGSFKAPPLRQVELTGPFFHNGENLTLRQQLDFYLRGGNFPMTNSAHRDFLIMNLNIEDEALGDGVDILTGLPISFTEQEKEDRRVAVIDFLLELTDHRVRYEQAPFDHPEIFVPLDGTAPDNIVSRSGLATPALLAGVCPGGTGPCFRQVPAVGAGGSATPLPAFLGVTNVRINPNCNPDLGPISHYCHSDGAGVGSCSPVGSTDATCDGVDDDCDGQFDEDYLSAATSCGAAPCVGTGQTSCVNGNQVDSCAPPAPLSVVTVESGSPMMFHANTALPEDQVLVQLGSSMRYLANSGDPGIGLLWTGEAFNDTSWSGGLTGAPYGVGYDTGAAPNASSLIQTTVPSGTFSVYTRARFTIADVSQITALLLGADYDDGYVAYVNGVEVSRASMPAGNPDWSTNATLHESSNGATPNYGTLANITAAALPVLHNGTNVLAIGVWNTDAPGSTDLVIVPRLAASFNANTALPEDQIVAQLGSPMRYLANSGDPGIGLLWTGETFSDVSWSGGLTGAPYGVGYDTGAAPNASSLIQTTVPSGTFSVYTRARFTVADASQVRSLLLGADYDDGYVAYVNGVEVSRASMPAGNPAWDTNATLHESSNGATPNYGTPVDITAAALPVLHNGTNVLAIGVWNSGAPASTDLVIVPKLTVVLNWAAESYSDAAWSGGLYGVGYETAAAPPNALSLINTSVPTGTYSVYTRAPFTVTNLAAVTGLFFGADFDDGYVAYVNGVEVSRASMPAGNPAWNTDATLHESSNGATPNYGTLIDISSAIPFLHEGTNVLAVGVWNNGAPASTDLVVVPRLSIDKACGP